MLESFEFKALQADDTHHTFKASLKSRVNHKTCNS